LRRVVHQRGGGVLAFALAVRRRKEGISPRKACLKQARAARRAFHEAAEEADILVE
jgi:hypothetical protein